MSDLNSVTLMGRLVRDAEARQTSSGKNCALFSMVVNRTKKENDQYVQTPHFFNLALNKYSTKIQASSTRCFIQKGTAFLCTIANYS